MKHFTLPTFLLSIAFTSVAHAEIYKWTDANGNVHFGDTPHNKEQATELKIDIKAKSGITHSSGNDKDRDFLLKQRDKDRAEKAEKKKKYQAKKKSMKRKCSVAKDRLGQYLRANAVYEVNAKGERKYYSSKERAKNEKKLRKSISKYCSY